MHKELLSQALEALEACIEIGGCQMFNEPMRDKAIASLRAALAEGEAEPVAWRLRIGNSDVWGYTQSESDADFHGKASGLPYVKEPLYPSPAALRAAVIEECANECERTKMYPGGRCEAYAHNTVWEAAAAIRALKENG